MYVFVIFWRPVWVAHWFNMFKGATSCMASRPCQQGVRPNMRNCTIFCDNEIWKVYCYVSIYACCINTCTKDKNFNQIFKFIWGESESDGGSMDVVV